MTPELTEDSFERPLNWTLYNNLRQRFGEVRIANGGMRMIGQAMRDPLDPQRMRMNVSAWGEYYRLCCPYCRDTRFRLWINHLYGQANLTTGFPATWLAVCYNENCTADPMKRDQLERACIGFRNRGARQQVMKIEPGETDDTAITPVTAPGDIAYLHQLPADHAAVQYVASRGYDANHLGMTYRVGYIFRAHDPEEHYLAGRIYIPVVMEEQLVGWQARYVGEANWKLTRKYLNRRNMPRRRMLYGIDTAKQWPFVVAVEGVTSVWRLGGPTVATFGKVITGWQQILLQRVWPGKPIVLMLDPDARDDMEGVLDEMIRAGRNPVVPVYMPPKYDPAEYTREVGVRMILSAAQQCGIELPPW